MKHLENKKCLIVGMGLIGGSIARCLRKIYPGIKIVGYDMHQASIDLALSDGTLSEGVVAEQLLESACSQADVIVMALPSLKIIEILPLIASYVQPDTVVTDTGSVKGSVSEAVLKLGLDFSRRFVPGHPIAGSEKSGYEAAKPTLFENRKVILTPLAVNESEAVALVNVFWRSLGAEVLSMDIEKHDKVLAATSHLPHLLSYTLVDVLSQQKQNEDIFRYAAGGFADFSRLASSNPEMWADIFVANSQATSVILDEYIGNLTEFKKVLTSKSRPQLLSIFKRAKERRDYFIDYYYSPDPVSMTTSHLENPQRLDFFMQSGGSVSGVARVPGDKSISHRSIILGAIADGVSHVSGFLEGEDALNTLAAFREMGVSIVGPDSGKLTIFGVGKDGLQAPRKPLYMGNSGTAMRLMAGVLAAQPFTSILTGDVSLSGRPMNRIVKPLTDMGAVIETGEKGTPPLHIRGTKLTGIHYEMPIASAQVKSCLLLAGLYAEGETSVSEPAPCRDHSERMLNGFAYPVSKPSEGLTSVNNSGRLTATDIEVPGDISSAAFFMVAAAITPDADLLLPHVGINPTRTGILNILNAMGADITLSNNKDVGGEPVADIRVRYSALRGIEIPQDQIPLAIDEFPVIFIAAACAQGETVLRGAQELRVKESDRIDAMARGLTTLGIVTEVFDDGIRITGGQLGGGIVDCFHDHRIAMAFSVASLRADSSITVRDCANVATSFPDFVGLAASVGLNIESREV